MAKYKYALHHKWRWQRVTQIMARDGVNCHICGRQLDRKIKDHLSDDYITFDHIQPVSKGGITAVSNLRLAHLACNRRRGNDPLAEEKVIFEARES